MGECAYLDVAAKIAQIIYGATNLALMVYIFVWNRRKSLIHREVDRRQTLLKALILDHSIEKFYTKCENIINNLNDLKKSNQATRQKQEVIKKVRNHLSYLRSEFYDLFRVVDTELYNKLITISDKFDEKIVESIEDAGINLNVEKYFKIHIYEVFIVYKTETIKCIYNYIPDSMYKSGME